MHTCIHVKNVASVSKIQRCVGKLSSFDILVEFDLVDFSDTAGKEIKYELIYKGNRDRDRLSYFWNDGIFLKE